VVPRVASPLTGTGGHNDGNARVSDGRSVTQLLRHAAASRAVPEADQDQWVGERKHQVDQIRINHPDLWRVPLLATLLTLLAAGREPGTLPSSRAHLMAEAVRDTVRRWELTRQQQDMPGLLGDQLIDGYSEIAHAILASPGAHSSAPSTWRTRWW
jgi:hypothetical protein